MLAGKRILLGVGGGIAAYRAAELARLMMKQGADVQCVPTRAASEFVTPLTFEALTRRPAPAELFDLTREREMGHIRLAREADALLVAPATADLIARFAHGICDDLLTTLFQVCEAPALLAPAMNASMWQSPATRRNVETLMDSGVRFIGPEEGELACGERGPGRMSEPATIIEALAPLVTPRRLAGQRWVVNAGPTWERWDDARVLTNRASGRLGAHLAAWAAAMGARVTLVCGPGVPRAPATVGRINVESAGEMMTACLEAADGADVFVATAAVSDYRFAEPVSGKARRDDGPIQVTLEPNEDIVARIAAMPGRPRKVIAFAAESDNHVERARRKMAAKGADAIFANDIRHMGDDTGSGWWVAGDVEEEIVCEPKAHLARWIIERIMELAA